MGWCRWRIYRVHTIIAPHDHDWISPSCIANRTTTVSLASGNEAMRDADTRRNPEWLCLHYDQNVVVEMQPWSRPQLAGAFLCPLILVSFDCGYIYVRALERLAQTFRCLSDMSILKSSRCTPRPCGHQWGPTRHVFPRGYTFATDVSHCQGRERETHKRRALIQRF